MLCLCCLHSCAQKKAAREQNILLKGTIGKFPVVFEINPDDAVYYYTSAKKNIELEGEATGQGYTFYKLGMGDKGERDDTLEKMTINSENEKWIGKWHNKKGKQYDVELVKVNVAHINNPYRDLPVVKEMRQKDWLAYMRTAGLEIVNDSAKENGKYKMQYCHISKTQLYTFRFTAGLEPALMNKVNDIMVNKLLDDAQNYFSCTSDLGDGDYHASINSVYLTDNVISVDRSVSYYCGGAHPDGGSDPININAKTGEELLLDDLLHFGNPPAHADDDSLWLSYRDGIFAPKLLALFTGLYPAQMQKPTSEDSCDYSQPDVWTFPQFYFTKEGLYIAPSFPHVMAGCGYPEWSVIPYHVLKKYINPAIKLSLP